ncbi:hypothetical protein HDU81_010335, partial [Chytriomyces hyalinus]
RKNTRNTSNFRLLEWCFPVWTKDELIACRETCHPDVSMAVVLERFRISGGMLRSIFTCSDGAPVKRELGDIDAAKLLRQVGEFSQAHVTYPSLVHMIVDDGYRFQKCDFASEYFLDQIKIKHASQMLQNLRDSLGGSPNEISGERFEIYGHNVFSVGGSVLRCRNLTTNECSKLTLIKLGGVRWPLPQEPVLRKPILHYHQPANKRFPGIDSLSPQGLFQFTVAEEHPVRGVDVLTNLCGLYDTPPRLFFVVPPHSFKTFAKQRFLKKDKKGKDDVVLFEALEQYVLELTV